jgi:hypothetical protein
MPLIRCTSCAYANAASAKVCKKCGAELRVPRHMLRCQHCGSLNPAGEAACVHCYRKLPGSWPRSLRGRPARGVAAATGVALLVVLGYYAYPRGLPQDELSPQSAAPASPVLEPPAKPPRPATDAPRAEATRVKSPPPAVAQSQGSSARKAERGVENCAEGVAALGLCSRPEARQPPAPQACTEAVAALGLCEPKNIQGRE